MTSERLQFTLGRGNRVTEEILNLTGNGLKYKGFITYIIPSSGERLLFGSLRKHIRDCWVVTEVSRSYSTNNLKRVIETEGENKR